MHFCARKFLLMYPPILLMHTQLHCCVKYVIFPPFLWGLLCNIKQPMNSTGFPPLCLGKLCNVNSLWVALVPPSFRCQGTISHFYVVGLSDLPGNKTMVTFAKPASINFLFYPLHILRYMYWLYCTTMLDTLFKSLWKSFSVLINTQF